MERCLNWGSLRCWLLDAAMVAADTRSETRLVGNCADVRNVDDEYRIHRTLYNITAHDCGHLQCQCQCCLLSAQLGIDTLTNLNYM